MSRRGTVVVGYRQPYPDPIRVAAGEQVVPDFDRRTDIPGWVWCTDARGKSGWTPQAWLERRGDAWHVTRDFDAIELTVAAGEALTLHLELAGFYWSTTADGRSGWVPADQLHVEAGTIDPESVLAWWFGDTANDPAAADGRGSFWFGTDAAVDAEIQRRFAPVAIAAAAGELSNWADAPRSCLALVIALDQFPRNLYRGTRSAFAQDAKAFGIAERAVGRGLLLELAPVEQAFLLMPYQHAELRTVQRRSIALLEAAAGRAAPQWRKLMSNFARYAREHAAIVERFGRFPHRNAALGRHSTPDETAYLAAKHNTFGQ